jgi:acyl-CoA thioester hydrolase
LTAPFGEDFRGSARKKLDHRPLSTRTQRAMPYEFKTTLRVQFSDTDMAGIVHFANYLRYMEAAEHAFLRSLGYSVHMREGERTIGWPRVKVACEFRAPLRFEDEVEVHLLVREKKEKSLTYEFIFRKLGDGPAGEVARGSITAVCVTMDEESGRMKATAIPEGLASAIEIAPR